MQSPTSDAEMEPLARCSPHSMRLLVGCVLGGREAGALLEDLCGEAYVDGLRDGVVLRKLVESARRNAQAFRKFENMFARQLEVLAVRDLWISGRHNGRETAGEIRRRA